MVEIVAHFTNGNVPLTSPGTVPTIRIRRIDTGALVVTDSDMTELGDGSYQFTFAPVATLEYSIRADGDPAAAGQVTPGERYKFGDLSGITEDRIATIELLDDHIRGTILINRTTDPWREEHLDVEDGSTVRDSFDLFDGNGNAINDANPLTNFIKERRRV